MKAMKKITEFNGSGNVERWIDRFELAVEIDGVVKEAQVLSMYLSEAAYDVWKNLPEKEKGDAKMIKAALRRTFGIKRADAWKMLLTKSIVEGEPLEVAGDQIRNFFKISCDGGDPVECVTGLVLLNALPTKIQDQIKLQIGNDLTYTNVLSAAQKIWPSMAESSVLAGF